MLHVSRNDTNSKHIQNIFAENVYSESNQASITNFEFTKDTDDGGAS